MINIHDLATQDVNNPNFLTNWENAFNQDDPSLDWLPYFYEAQLRMKTSSGEASGDILYFPAGTYHFSATLHFVRGVHLVGEGIGNTVLSIHANNDESLFADNQGIVPQDGMILHFPGADKLIGKDFKRYIPPFPNSIDSQTQKDLFIEVVGGIDSSGFGVVIEKVSVNGNNSLRHGVVQHIPGTIQDCEIYNFLENGVHLFAHVDGRHDLALLYGQLPNGTLNIPNHNHPDSTHGTANPFNIPKTPATSIDARSRFVAYMRQLFKANGYANNEIPSNADLLTAFDAHQSSGSPNVLTFSIDTARTEVSGLALTQNPAEGVINVDYDGSETDLGNIPLYLTFTGQFDYTDANMNNTVMTIVYDHDFLINFSFFHESFDYPFVRSNASTWKVFRSTIRNCGGHGLYTFNLDANAGMAQAVSCINNGKFGFYDDSNLGNTYVGCYAAGNGQNNQNPEEEGNYWSGLADSGVNVSYFIGCSSDSSVPSRFGKPGVVIGGNIKRMERPLTQEVAKGGKPALILEDSGTFNLMGVLRFMSYNDTELSEADRHTHMEFGWPGEKTVFSFTSYDVNEKKYSTRWQMILKQLQGNNYDDKEWNVLSTNNQPNYHRMALAGPESQHHNGNNDVIPVNEGSVWFQNGYYLAANDNYQTDGFIKVNAAEPDNNNPEQPDMTKVIALYPGSDIDTSNPRRPQRGDILFNSAPLVSSPLAQYSGWICVGDYTEDLNGNITREQWMPFGKIHGGSVPG